MSILMSIFYILQYYYTQLKLILSYEITSPQKRD